MPGQPSLAEIEEVARLIADSLGYIWLGLSETDDCGDREPSKEGLRRAAFAVLEKLRPEPNEATHDPVSGRGTV